MRCSFKVVPNARTHNSKRNIVNLEKVAEKSTPHCAESIKIGVKKNENIS
jgi:hypothetical protein